MSWKFFQQGRLCGPRGIRYIYADRNLIGSREVVGYGFNGRPVYGDVPHTPFPAIRYKEHTTRVQALRELEKGDWRKISIEDKKAIYRANFGRTFAEMNAPSADWMDSIGNALFIMAGAIFYYILFIKYCQLPLPDTYLLANKTAQEIRQRELHVNDIDGLYSNWDYQRNKWKA